MRMFRVVMLSLVALAGLAGPASARVKPWTSLGGDAAHTGGSPVVSAQAPRLQVLGWPYATSGQIGSSPVVAADGTVYVGSGDRFVYALNPNGLVRWGFRARAAVSDPLALGPNGWLYAVDAKGTLYAIDSSGRLKWRARLGLGAPGVVVSAGVVYAGASDGVTAFSLAGGRLWHSATSEIAGVAAGPGGVYATTFSGRLIALTESGQLRWTVKLSAMMAAPTIAPGQTVYLGTLSGRFYAIDSRGHITWSRKLAGAVVGSAALRPGGGVYIGSGLPGLRGSVSSFTASGRRLWSFKAGDAVFSSAAVAADGTIYFGSEDEYIYAVRPDGRRQWRYQTGKPVDSSPAIGPDGTLYIGSDDGQLYAFAGPPARPSRSGSGSAAFTPASRVSGHAGLIAPGALAVGAGGRLFVADLLRYGIVELSAEGRSIGVLGRRGIGPGQFRVPTGVGVDGRGNVFVSDGASDNVQEFVPDSGGFRFERSFGSWRVGGNEHRLVQPLALALGRDRDRVYVGDYRYGIVSFTETGRYLGSWSPGSGYLVHGLSSGPDGDLYATFDAKSGVPGAQRSYQISADLKLRRNLGFADPAGADYLAPVSAGGFFALSPAPGASVTKYKPIPGGFQELSFFLTPIGFQYGIVVNASNQVFVPSFPNAPRPGGAVNVYSPTNANDPNSSYRRTAILRGG